MEADHEMTPVGIPRRVVWVRLNPKVAMMIELNLQSFSTVPPYECGLGVTYVAVPPLGTFKQMLIKK